MTYNIIFMGTPDFALPSLTALHTDPRYNITSIYTQGDKPVGRKQVVTPPVVKQYGLDHDIPVHQPKSLRKDPSLYRAIREEEPDFIVVVAYGKIIPKEILEIPKIGVINVHGSILPKHRGAAPIQAALLSGDKETGVTIMLMSEGLDEGDILSIATISILESDTAGDLFHSLSVLGAQELVETLDRYAKGEIRPQPQDHSKATHQGKITKKLGEINLYTMSARDIYQKWQGLTPWPGIYTYTSTGKRLKLLRLVVPSSVDTTLSLRPGEIKITEQGVAIGTTEGTLYALTLQLEGKKAMEHDVFYQGNQELKFMKSSE